MELRYGEKGFVRKARAALARGEAVDLSIAGWRARLLVRRMPLLLELASGEQIPSESQTRGGKYIAELLAPTYLCNGFMVILWSAVAEKRKMTLVSQGVDGIMVRFA